MSTSELARREERAQGGIIQFAEEMQAIRDGNLYPGAKQEPDAWPNYCKDRWGMGDRTVDQTIQALPVLKRFISDRVADDLPSMSAAAAVATLPEPVQDAILAESPRRNDASDKAKAARKAAKTIQENEGREPPDDELIAAATAVKSKPKKRKSKKHSRFTRYLTAGLHEVQNAADYAQGDVLSDTENDFAWTVVGRLEHQIERIKDKLFQPDHVRDVDAEFAELLGGDES